jgi:predicted GNAT family acetyltransferase
MTPVFRHNKRLHRYELDVDGAIAFVAYKDLPQAVVFTHTEVPDALSGRGLGTILARQSLESVRADGRAVIAQCPFMARFIQKTPEFADLLLENRNSDGTSLSSREGPAPRESGS